MATENCQGLEAARTAAGAEYRGRVILGLALVSPICYIKAPGPAHLFLHLSFAPFLSPYLFIHLPLSAWPTLTKVILKARVITLVLHKVPTIASHLAGSKSGTRQTIATFSKSSLSPLSTPKWIFNTWARVTSSLEML